MHDNRDADDLDDGSEIDDLTRDDDGSEDDGSGVAESEEKLQAATERANKLEHQVKQLLSEKNRTEAGNRELDLRRSQLANARERELAIEKGISTLRSSADPVHQVIMGMGGEVNSLEQRLRRLEDKDTSKVPEEDSAEVEDLMQTGFYANREVAHDALMGRRFKEGKAKPVADPPAEKPPARTAPAARTVATTIRSVPEKRGQDVAQLSSTAYRERLAKATANLYGEGGTPSAARQDIDLVRKVRSRAVKIAGE